MTGLPGLPVAAAFLPVVPAPGYAGWRFLERTAAAQSARLAAEPLAGRETAYFRAEIGKIGTAAELVADRRLLRVALTAFGLEADLNAGAFLRRVLEDGTLNPRALANRLADKRYLDFAKAFGFGDFSVPNTRLSDFPDRILARFAERRFEAAAGAVDPNLRLALGGRRELAALAARETTDTARWYSVLGNPPLRRLFETAFGLPAAFAAIDLDRQVAMLRSKAEAAFGDRTVAQFADPARMEALVRRFFARAEAEAGALPAGAGRMAGALFLLRSGQI